MNAKDFIKDILTDIRVDLTEEFDRNFERKAFFDKKWKNTILPNQRGSLMMRSGKLRRSIRAKQDTQNVNWSSSLPYATINNEGGEIEVTEQMKKFFWAMAYKAGMAAGKGKSERSQRLSAEAQQWKNLALQKVGTKMKIEQRQYIGDHPVVRQRAETIIDDHFTALDKIYYSKLKK